MLALREAIRHLQSTLFSIDDQLKQEENIERNFKLDPDI